jgi:hypothetical protein
MSVRDERFEALLGAAAPLVAAVFDALPDAIGVVWPTFDAAGALVDFEIGYTNPSSERMMGVRLGDEVGARLRARWGPLVHVPSSVSPGRAPDASAPLPIAHGPTGAP